MQRFILISLILSPLVCYLEWSGDSSSFLFQMEYLLFFKSANASENFTHPLVLLPFIGQVLILFTVFQKKPNKKLALTGQILLSLIVIMVLLSGILSKNIKIISSTLPFIATTIAFYFSLRKKKNAPEVEQ